VRHIFILHRAQIAIKRAGDGKTREEKLIIEGCEVKINYAKQDNPEALAAIRSLLEKQRIAPKSAQKFDDIAEKCENNDR
jgi:hypothetical protein